MYHAASEKIVEECTERAIDLLQLIVSICEMWEENRVKQLTDTWRKSVVCTSSVTLSEFQILYDLNASELQSM